MNEHGIQCHSDGIQSYGNKDSGVMLIGIAPGRNEVRLGKPFVGESGRLLDAILKGAGWSRDDVYCTNLICTWNDEPSAQELAACRPRLLEEIRTMRPRLIIPLGKIAAEEVISSRTIGKMQGAVLWTTDVLGSGHDCYVLLTYHPAAILHGVSAYVHPIYRDLCKIKDVVQWAPEAPHAKLHNYVVAQSAQEAQYWIEEVLGGSYLAVDIETAQGKTDDGMLDVFNDRLLCVGLSDGTNTIVIPEEFCHDLDWHQDEIPYTFHFGSFDVQGLQRFLSVRLPIVHDTMLMSYNLDERAGVHGLKGLAREYLGAGFYEDEIYAHVPKKGGTFADIPKDILYEYNARDACYTARLAPILFSKMVADNVLWPYEHLMIPAANVFADAQYRGIKVDMDMLNAMSLKWMMQWKEAEEALRQQAESYGAPAPFNPNSNDQLKKLVFGNLGLTSALGKVSAKTGVPSLDKDVLEELAGSHPFIDDLSNYRQLTKIVTGYLLVIRDMIKLDGCLHATVRQHGTVTARTSMELLQTVPSPKYDRNAKYKELRSIFVPHDSNTHVIVEADYSRAEMYVAIAYSHDKNMMADLETGDPHSQAAAYAFKKPLEQVTKQDRTDAKHLVFGKMYGRGARAMHKAEFRNWNLADVEGFIARWEARYPQYMKWNQQQRITATTKGELVSLDGRKRRFRLILPDDFKLLNEAVNAPIQSLASDVTMSAMIRLHTALREYDSYVLLMIHDSIVFEVSRQHLDRVLDVIKKIMEEPQVEGVPSIPIELATGDNWASTKEVIIHA